MHQDDLKGKGWVHHILKLCLFFCLYTSSRTESLWSLSMVKRPRFAGSESAVTGMLLKHRDIENQLLKNENII